jgi:hypothetical protein
MSGINIVGSCVVTSGIGEASLLSANSCVRGPGRRVAIMRRRASRKLMTGSLKCGGLRIIR